jgi:hydroxymethylglutaryl-CoA reductase (NADPH)
MKTSLRTFTTAQTRRVFLEESLAVSLPHIGAFSFDEKQATAKHIENMIGGTQIPLGVAGPLIVHGEVATGEHYIPLATTEGALVASLSRGCKALSDAGGVNVTASYEGMTRGPVFHTGSLQQSKKLEAWLKTNKEKLQEIAASTSSHLHLKKIIVSMLADTVFVRFSFMTGEAMGMNMVTIASEKMVRVIEKETGTTCLAVAGNYDIDKKPAWLNFINKRGYAVWAEARIPKQIVASHLKTTPEKLFDVWLNKCIMGSIMSGSLGFNSQYANVIAALFIATGQDLAHVVEGSMGVTTMKVLPNGNLYCAVYLPALLLGVVGGGTQLATQKEALQILALPDQEKSKALAEITAGAVLAGELSLLASLAEGTLGTAHKALGRGE